MSESLPRKAPCECWSNPETGQMEACSVHEPWFIEYAYTISDLRQTIAQQASQIATLTNARDGWKVAALESDTKAQSMREALEKAPHGEKCILPWKHICNCWKSAALAQVSASTVKL